MRELQMHLAPQLTLSLSQKLILIEPPLLQILLITTLSLLQNNIYICNCMINNNI